MVIKMTTVILHVDHNKSENSSCDDGNKNEEDNDGLALEDECKDIGVFRVIHS